MLSDRNSTRNPASRDSRLLPLRRSLAAGLVGAGLLGLSLVPQTASVNAQRAEAPGIQTPYGRAPLSFADLVDRVKPAVVSVHVKGAANRGGSRGGRGLLPELPEDHPLHEFFKNLPREAPGQPTPRPAQAQGSGFVISADGYVVTNNHVIDGAGKVQVSFDENNKYDAEVVGTDSRTDLALLKINGSKPFPFVKFADKPARVGDWALAVGNPFGLGGTVTAGIVSAQNRDIGAGPYDDFIQIDAPVNRGNSGGPTFNLAGEVVGVNTAIFSPSGGNVGIAFAIPASTVEQVVASLKESGSVTRGFIGVQMQAVTKEIAEAIGLKEPRGALVAEALKDGPAAKAGVRTGDAIVAVDGEPVKEAKDLSRKVAKVAPGKTVSLTLYRDGKERTVTLEVAPQPKA
jgi:serine protease Do